MSTHTHTEGCMCAGLDAVCPDWLRRADVDQRYKAVMDRSDALVAAASGKTVLAPPRVLHAHEVLKRFEIHQAGT